MAVFAFSAYILDAQRPTRLLKPFAFRLIWLYKSFNKAHACKAISSICKDVTGTLACSSAAELWAVTITLLELLVLLMTVLLVGRITSVSVFLDCKGTRNILTRHSEQDNFGHITIQLASCYIIYLLKKTYWAQSLEVTSTKMIPTSAHLIRILIDF